MTAKIAFPPPPPTTNTLTIQQRALRLRSAKKLGRMLGSTPQWVDEDVDVPFMSNSNATEKQHHTPLSRSSSRASLSSAILSRSSTFPPARSSRSASLIKPLLRQAFSPTLEPIPASPVTPTAPRFTTLIYRPASLLSTSTTESSSPVKTTSTIRREKMERLRRKLGNEVPIGMVFPDIQEEDELAEVEDDYPEDPHPELNLTVQARSNDATRAIDPEPQLSIPVPRTRPPPLSSIPSSISLARDSVALLEGQASPHHAPRKGRPSIDSAMTSPTFDRSMLPIIDESNDGPGFDFYYNNVDVDEEEEEEEEEEVNEEEEELNRISNWVDAISKYQQKADLESAWFSEEEESLCFSDPDSCYSPSEPSSPMSSVSHHANPGKLVQCGEAELDLHDDVDARLMFWRKPGKRWQWGVPQESSERRKFSGESREFEGFTGMLF